MSKNGGHPLELPKFTTAEEIRPWFKTADDSLLAKITCLSLSDQDIREIPPELFKLTNLQKLDLSSNEPLQTLPPESGFIRKF